MNIYVLDMKLFLCRFEVLDGKRPENINSRNNEIVLVKTKRAFYFNHKMVQQAKREFE